RESGSARASEAQSARDPPRELLLLRRGASVRARFSCLSCPARGRAPAEAKRSRLGHGLALQRAPPLAPAPWLSPRSLGRSRAVVRRRLSPAPARGAKDRPFLR